MPDDTLTPEASIADGRIIGASPDLYELLQEAESLLFDPTLPVDPRRALPFPWRVSTALQTQYGVFVIIAANGSPVGRIHRQVDAEYITRVLNELQ